MPVGFRTGLLAVATLGLVIGACHRPVAADGKAATARPRKVRAGAPAPSRTAHLILLPDSAISVEPGSTEERLATYLASDQPAPRMFRFAGTEFEPWHSKPTPATLRTMYAIAQILRAYPKTRVTLVGHTDNDGTPEQNLALSQARVDHMAGLLVHSGVQARRITTIGRGLSSPIADNATIEGRARNRRIELIVTAK
ncbi:MAG TPA: OmpA family protein [Sphingomonas sp.]|nr:OmpA family protein [Sphingomonas sp.]